MHMKVNIINNNSKAIYLKELRTYFNSTIAYIVIVVFLIISGWFFASNVFLANVASLRVIFEVIPLIFIFFVPAVTMRLFSEEKKTGTLEILLTKPVNDIDLIIGKFLSAWALLGISMLPTLIYYFTISFVGRIDIGPVIGGYLGLLLMGGVYVSIGIFASSVTENQVVAFIIGFMAIFVLFMLDKVLIFVPMFLVPIFEYLSIDYHFSNIARGVIDSRDLIYYLSLGYVFILLTQVSLERRKW
jgi:ABC-2 type transport system permease protein